MRYYYFENVKLPTSQIVNMQNTVLKIQCFDHFCFSGFEIAVAINTYSSFLS